MDCPLINNYQSQSQSLFDLQSLLDRFQTAPEPEQSYMIEATLRRAAMQQHLERIAERIRSHDEPCSACIERLTRAVIAAESIRGIDHLDKYKEKALQLMEAERTMLLKELEESKHHQEDAEEEEDVEEEDEIDENFDYDE